MYPERQFDVAGRERQTAREAHAHPDRTVYAEQLAWAREVMIAELPKSDPWRWPILLEADPPEGAEWKLLVDEYADGSRVAFISNAKNLGGFATPEYRVFVKDIASGALTFASPPESGTPTVSARQLTFSSDASHIGWIEDAAA